MEIAVLPAFGFVAASLLFNGGLFEVTSEASVHP